MIRDAEVRRLAGSAGVEPRIVELDYVLGWALRGIMDHPYLADRLVFKGGTCLHEVMAFGVAHRRLSHPFSDADTLGDVQIPCYSLDEVMAEKLRAVLGQRIHAVSRDLYDIFWLMDHTKEQAVLAGLPGKMDARGINADGVDLGRMAGRREEFRADWDRNLAGLLPPGAVRTFDEVWAPVAEFVGRMVDGLGRAGPGIQG